MKYDLKNPVPARTVFIPSEACRFLPAASAADVKILLYIYEAYSKDDSLSSFDEDTLSEETHIADTFSREEISHALGFWRAAGILSESGGAAPYSEPAPDAEVKKKKNALFDPSKKPSYTSSQLADAARVPEFSELLAYTESRLNKMLNPSELATLYSFYDYLALPTDVIMLATEHCVSEGKRSLRYIEKLLLDFTDKDITTYEAAEAYINSRRHYKTLEGKVRTLCGMGERALTKSEKTIIGEWASNPEFDTELLTEAYEATIRSIGKPTLAYINKILLRWANDGITTVAALSEAKEKTDASKGFVDKTYDLEGFFKAAVEKERK